MEGHKMKRFVALLMAVALLMTLTACGNEKAEKYCWNCGEGISKDVSFCSNCGTEQGGSEEATTSATVETAKEQKSTATKKTTTTKAPTPTQRPTESQQPAHTHSYSKKVVAATCTEKGYTLYTCSCGDTYKDNYTNPSHTYSNYVCSACGAVDKAHAYDYLTQWIKRNGKVDGAYVEYLYRKDDTQYSLSYSAKWDYLYVSSYEDTGDRTLFTSVHLDEFYYGMTWEDYERIDINGFLSAGEFTRNSPLAYEEYTGQDSYKHDFIELARLSINDLLQWLEWMLKKENIGITLSDLGFSAY
jgi:hypothetical protein